MTETLINSLSQITDLSVKARSSVFRYKDKNIDPQQAGNELSVQAVLNGRVAQRQDNIILNLELVDVSSGNQIWGEQYNRKTNDLVSLQSEIARDVSRKLHQKITGSAGQNIAKRYTTDSEAYKLYLRGLFHWNKRTTEDLKKAIDYFNHAKEKDPSFALAYAGLAVTYSVLPNNSVMTKQEEDEIKLKAKASTLKALELDDNLAEAYAVLAGEKVELWDFKGAENDFKKAIKLNPNFATARQWYSELLSIQERHSEAIAEVEKAVELDPFSPAVNFNVGIRYLQAGRPEEAINQFQKTIELAPDYHMPYRFLSLIYFHEKKYKEALAFASKAQVLMRIKTPESARKEEIELLQVLNSEGEKGYWQRMLKGNLEYYEKGIGSPLNVAISFAELGEKEKAFEWLEKAYAERDRRLIYIKSELSFRSLHSDPRFKDLLRRVGLPF
jgi:adenylate cyclase